MGRLSDFELDRIGHSIGYVNPRVSTLERMNKTGQSQPVSGDALKRGQAEKSMEKSKNRKKGIASGKLKGKGGY